MSKSTICHTADCGVNIKIALTVGQRFFMNLDEFTQYSGTVRWTQGHRFGIDFDAPLAGMPQNLESDAGA